MRRKIMAALFVFSAAGLISPPAEAQNRFRDFEFRLRGDVVEVISADLTGDGLDEVIAITIDKSSRPAARVLNIFIQNSKGFDRARIISWPLPSQVVAVDVGDVDPNPGDELVLLTEAGASYAAVTEDGVGNLKELVKYQSAIAIAGGLNAPYHNFARDLNGDGKDDLLVCGFAGALFAKQGEDYNFTTETIALRPQVLTISSDITGMIMPVDDAYLAVNYSVPQFHSADANADGRPDLIANFTRDIHIFTQDPNGFFSKEPAKTYHIQFYEAEESPLAQQMAAGLSFSNMLAFADLDGDGRVDIVASQLSGSITSIKSKSCLFWGKSQGIEKGKPDLVFDTQAPVMGAVLVRDMNKDGRLDIIMPTHQPSVSTVVRSVVSGVIDLVWEVYLQRPDHGFNVTPDQRIPTVIPSDIRSQDIFQNLPNVISDFNGDGYPDLMEADEKDALVVTIRDKDGQKTKIIERINVMPSMFNRAVDLNGDGRADLIILYANPREKRRDLHLVMNHGPW
ncbi:MAG TPA: VCBS repeat-containing protein [bacterium]|nr:VCBS repeat-containing protein [bacterium]